LLVSKKVSKYRTYIEPKSIKESARRLLPKDQAGFRRGRSTCDQVAAL